MNSTETPLGEYGRRIYIVQRRIAELVKGVPPMNAQDDSVLVSELHTHIPDSKTRQDVMRLTRLLDMQIGPVDLAPVIFGMDVLRGLKVIPKVEILLNNSAVPKAMPRGHALYRLPITLEDARFLVHKCNWKNYLGHAEVANEYGEVLGIPGLQPERNEYTLGNGSIVLVGEVHQRLGTDPNRVYDPHDKTWSLNICYDAEAAIAYSYDIARQH